MEFGVVGVVLPVGGLRIQTLGARRGGGEGEMGQIAGWELGMPD